MRSSLGSLRPASLTSRLVATAVALVLAVSVLIAAATTVAIRAYLIDRLDDEIRQASSRAVDGPPAPRQIVVTPLPDGGGDGGGRGGRDGGGRGGRDEPGRGFDDAFGQGAGTVTALLDGTPAGTVITRTGERPALDAEVLYALDEVPDDGRIHSLDLPGLGSYRLLATSVGEGVLVTGLPTDAVGETVMSLLAWEVVLTGLGVSVAGAAAWVLVRRQLRPLREVAATAHAVAELPLSTGDVGVTARVPDSLTDERTEVGQVGAALNTLLGHVEQSLGDRHRSEQQVRQFVADASHELRTPLATISGYAELARRTPGEAESLSHALAKVEVEAARMSSLVEDLLLLARLDAGRPLGRAPVDLTRLVLEATADARVTAPGHRWVLDLDDEPVIVGGDEQRLHQVLSNLLSNARRHTPPGTTVIVSVHGGEEQVSLAVEDDGPGIPEDLQPRLFERFARGDSARTRAAGGTGLGLSLARAIVEAHGGTISATSQPGRTRVTVLLPH